MKTWVRIWLVILCVIGMWFPVSAEGITGQEVQDGTYSIEVSSSSSMFRIVKADLTVSGGEMQAVLTLSGTGYEKLFMGTGEEAAQAAEEEMIPYVEDADGAYTYTVPVETLDSDIACAAFSKRKQQWYDRTLVFQSASLPAEALPERTGNPADEAGEISSDGSGDTKQAEAEKQSAGEQDAAKDAENGSEEQDAAKDAENGSEEQDASKDAENGSEEQDASKDVENGSKGQEPSAKTEDPELKPLKLEEKDGTYTVEVSLEGGSGRATVDSPAVLEVRDGTAMVRIAWSSPNYDYMYVNGKQYFPVNKEGNSVFLVPLLAFDGMEVVADTTAMSRPHEIAYTLVFDPATLKKAETGTAAVWIVAAVILLAIVICACVYLRRRKQKE